MATTPPTPHRWILTSFWNSLRSLLGLGTKDACIPLRHRMAFLLWNKGKPRPSRETFTSCFSLPFRMEGGALLGQPHCYHAVLVTLLRGTSLTLRSALGLVCMISYMSLYNEGSVPAVLLIPPPPPQPRPRPPISHIRCSFCVLKPAVSSINHSSQSGDLPSSVATSPGWRNREKQRGLQLPPWAEHSARCLSKQSCFYSKNNPRKYHCSSISTCISQYLRIGLCLIIDVIS